MMDPADSSIQRSGTHLSKDLLIAVLQHDGLANEVAANAESYSLKPDSGIRDTTLMFREYFDVAPATTQKLKEEVFRLRYQVYCSETRFENPADFPDQLERDKYDHRSEHSLLRHKRTGIDAGTVRLVRPEPEVLSSLPLHDVTDHPFFRDETRFPASTVAEVSRFAISRSFRRRLDEYPSPSAAGRFNSTRERFYREQEKKVLPHITLGLFIAMVKMSHEMGVKTWFCVMEKALVRLLARYSLYFEPIGPTIEYHGKRQPCYADIDKFLARVKAEKPDIWRLITANGAYWPTEKAESSTPCSKDLCRRTGCAG